MFVFHLFNIQKCFSVGVIFNKLCVLKAMLIISYQQTRSIDYIPHRERKKEPNQQGINKLWMRNLTNDLQILHNTESHPPPRSFHPEWLQRYLLLSAKILPLQQKMVVGVGVQNEQNINDEVKTRARP